MKQTIVMKISMKGPKCRTKALKIAVGVPGVEKAEFQGDDKCQIAVTGNEIDSIELTKLIRKKVGPTELVTVKEEKKEEKKEEVQAIVWQPSVYGVPGFYYPEAPRANDICTIL